MEHREKKHCRKKSNFIRILYLLLIGVSLFVSVSSLWRREYFHALIGVFTFGLYGMPRLTERVLGIWFPDLFEASVLLFIFATEILGEICCFYQRIPHWDSFLHGIAGFLLAAFGFSVFFVMARKENGTSMRASLSLAAFCLCFSVTVGVLWEFYEFGSDMLFHTDMQKDTYIGELYTVLLDEDNSNTVVSVTGMEKVLLAYVDEDGSHEVVLNGYIDVGLYDTMKDLAMNFLGAFVFAVLAYGKKSMQGILACGVIPRVE